MAPLLLPFLLLLTSPSAQAQTTISLGSFLTTQGPNTSWLSPSGEFAFGFRQVEGNSSAYLLAVWFQKISSQTVAWYAKTSDGEPVQVLSGSSLLLTSTGALSLQDPTRTEVWNPNILGAVQANMLDRGSFVLAGTGGSKLWQTFDSPTDTILLTQELTPEMALRSRIIPTDYSSGRFLLKVQGDSVALHRVAVPSAYDYGTYWSTDGNITNLVFDATGMLYVGANSTQINITSAPIRSVADYYHRATLDPDGAFRQYVYPKKASNQSNQAWSVVGMAPDNICGQMLNIGSGTCGFNSYCPLNPMNKVDWPLADYEQNTPVSKDDCQKLCLTDCFCAVAVYQDSSSTCRRKKMPLSNGNMGNGVDRILFVKVSKNNSLQSSDVKDSIKWNLHCLWEAPSL